jgi:hypothetical protein
MKDKDCIYCKKFFECKGKDTKSPCLHFEDRRKKDDHGENKQ